MIGNEILHIFMNSFIIFCLKVIIVACCVSLYICAGPELETSYKQATLTALTLKTYSSEGLENEKRFHNVQFIKRLPFWHSPCKVMSNS